MRRLIDKHKTLINWYQKKIESENKNFSNKENSNN